MVLDSGPMGKSADTEWILPRLKKGSAGASVKALQILLIGYGCSCGNSGVDGEFGTATQSALKSFQTQKKVTASGETNEETWKALLGCG